MTVKLSAEGTCPARLSDLQRVLAATSAPDDARVRIESVSDQRDGDYLRVTVEWTATEPPKQTFHPGGMIPRVVDRG